MILFVRGSITRWEFFCRLVIIWVKYHPNTIFLPGVTLPNCESFASKEYALMMWSNSFVFKREAVQGVRAWPEWPWDSTRSMCYLHNIDELVYKEMHGIHCQYIVMVPKILPDPRYQNCDTSQAMILDGYHKVYVKVLHASSATEE